jgi:hypothetical protein
MVMAKGMVLAKVAAQAGWGTLSLALSAALAVALAVPVVAQEYEEYERPPIEDPVRGYQRADGITVLDDTSFCSYLLGAIWGDERLTFRGLINRSRQQRPAKRAAFRPVADEPTLERCVEVLNAFRGGTGDEDRLPAWAREQPVVPEALVLLLPADPGSAPLAEPPPIGDGARTSGFGSRVSAPFVLWGGNYYVEPDTAGCETWTGAIRGLADPSVVAATVDGATNLYDVAMGNYYWDVVASECEWSVDLVTVEPVPDPTPTPRPMATVPRLVGSSNYVQGGENPEWLTAEQAREAIDAAGLVVGSCTEAFRFIFPPGRIMEQDPPAGAVVEPGSAVDLVVRSGSDGCQTLLAPG